MQHDSSKGTCERGEANNMDGEGKDLWAIGDTTLQSHSKENEVEFVYFVILWLNAFPVKSGISQTISPRELLMHWRLDYKKHCRVQPGTYCEVHDEPVPTNTMAWRAYKAIALGPTGNLQGSVKFYCINTGWVLKRPSFTPMPMPDRVIKRVITIGEREGQG